MLLSVNEYMYVTPKGEQVVPPTSWPACMHSQAITTEETLISLHFGQQTAPYCSLLGVSQAQTHTYMYTHASHTSNDDCRGDYGRLSGPSWLHILGKLTGTCMSHSLSITREKTFKYSQTCLSVKHNALFLVLSCGVSNSHGIAPLIHLKRNFSFDTL